jgi:hypothetical protein
MKRCYLSICLQIFLGILISWTTVLADEDAIPNDLKIIAQYKSGYSDWKPWKVTITSDGNVSQEIYIIDNTGEKTFRKSYSLSRDDLKEIITEIKESNFMTLSEKYSYDVTDNPTLILTVTINQKSHQVIVYAPSHLKKKEEVNKFLKVWNEVLMKVPSPNTEQKPY